MRKFCVFGLVYISVFISTYLGMRIFLHRPMFSIIVSVYNYEQYLPDTIESVLNSTDSDFELILVNDGSTDNSLEVIERFAKKDKRIRVINQENMGLSLARNNAMKIARGRYFWFVDADDWIDEEALSHLRKAINRTHYHTGNFPDVVSFYTQVTSRNKILRDLSFYDKFPTVFLQNLIVPYDGKKLPWYIVLSIPPTSGKQIYRREYVQQQGIDFPPHVYFEDECFFVTTLLSGAKGIVLPQILYYKRVHEKSITMNRGKYYASTVRLPMITYQYLKKVTQNEQICRQIFKHYFGILFNIYPKDAQYIPVLKELLSFIETEFPDDFGRECTDKLRRFIQEKEVQFAEKAT